jgi:phage gp46-like protein
MSADIALLWNQSLLQADIATARGDLLVDNGLQTAVTVSLLTDRLAEPGDVLPDNLGPRGWWADGYNGQRIGSRLWLLKRAVLTQNTLNLAQDYANEALAWLVEANIVGAVSVVATAVALNVMNLAVTLSQGNAQPVYNVLWSSTGQGVNA